MGRLTDWLKFQKEHRHVKKVLTTELKRSWGEYEGHLKRHGYSDKTAKKERQRAQRQIAQANKRNRKKRK